MVVPLANTEKVFSAQCIIYTLLLKSLVWKFQLQKPKLRPFKVNKSSEVKIHIEIPISEQVNNFNCLGYILTYKEEIDIEKKLQKFNRAQRIINQVFHPAKFLKQKLAQIRH
jgi:hypothetical protein